MFADNINEDVVRFKLLGGYKIRIWFKDGASGDVDISEIVKIRGIFEPLRDPAFFRQVSINPETFVLEWPNGADIDPEVLYAKATGTPIKVWVWREEVVEV